MASNSNDSRPARRRATSYDVARLAGVSQSAVSRCFKEGASVSDKTRKRVMAAVAELGYTPNAIARGLITRRSNMVAVIISNLSYYPEVLSELSRRFGARDVHVLLFTLEHERDAARVLEQVSTYQVDGVVAAAHLDEEQVSRLTERGVPLVFFNRAYDNSTASSVCCDQVEGERTLVNLLVDSGKHETFALIGGPPDAVVSVQRTQGAVDQLAARGIHDVWQAAGDYTYPSGRRALQTIIEARGRVPDAVICANDAMAMGVMDELRYHLNLDVPGDVSVVGFDGLRAAHWASFDLMTIEQPIESMAEAAAAMLLDRIDNDQLPPEQRTFAGVLRVGATVRL